MAAIASSLAVQSFDVMRDTPQFDELRDALRHHQVVALLGARGTGKTSLAQALISQYEEVGVKVVMLDARDAEDILDLNGPVAAALRCSHETLTPEQLGPDDVVRIIVDNCHEFYDRPWFPYLQEQWRALLSLEAARGRVGLLLLGRPLFRHVAGGHGSPLLTIGPILLVRPLTEIEVIERFGIAEEVARAVKRKTGGHPWLTRMLLEAIDRDVSNLGGAIEQFVNQHQRYLTRLAEDHTLAAMGVLADLVEAGHPIPDATLITAHFGSSYSDGQDALADLTASGLITRVEDTCQIAAELLRKAPAVRQFLRAPATKIPTTAPDQHDEGARIFYLIENRLRELIVQSLGSVDRAWWQTRVPSTFIGEAETRRSAELESPAAPEQEPHPIMFLSLGELFEIVQMKENWTQVFAVRLRRTAELVRDAARDLVAVRNKVAHNRPISGDDLELARNAARRLRLLE